MRPLPERRRTGALARRRRPRVASGPGVGSARRAGSSER